MIIYIAISLASMLGGFLIAYMMYKPKANTLTIETPAAN